MAITTRGSRESYDVSAAEAEINRRMCEGYKTGKHPVAPPRKKNTASTKKTGSKRK